MYRKELKVEVALNPITNEYVYPNDATIPRGNKAGVICVECRQALCKKDGDIKATHFSHINNKVNCNYSPETLKHIQGKELLKKSIGQDFYLPMYEIELPCYEGRKHIIQDIKKVKIDKVEIEKTITLPGKKDYIIADVILYTKNKDCIIELKKTHAVDDNKKQIIKRLKKSCVEVNLCDVELENLLKDTESKKWIYNNKLKLLKEKIINECEINIQNKKTIKDYTKTLQKKFNENESELYDIKEKQDSELKELYRDLNELKRQVESLEMQLKPEASKIYSKYKSSTWHLEVIKSNLKENIKKQKELIKVQDQEIDKIINNITNKPIVKVTELAKPLKTYKEYL